MNILFVGGIWDGKRTAIPDGQIHVDVPHAPRMDFSADMSKPPPVFENDHYHLVRLEGGHRLFVIDTMNVADLFARLINCYHPELVPESQR